MKRIEIISNDWHRATWDVIEFKNPGFDKVRVLFKDTCEIIEEYV